MRLTTTVSEPPVPNHHADHPGFSGIGGLAIGLVMLARDPYARLAVELADVAAGDVVVDVGCGPGRAARLAARRGATVVGVDPAEVMLRLARTVSRRPLPISWVAGSAEAVPVPDRSATVLWSIRTVHHWRDLTAGLDEARRVLVAGGRLLVLERHTTPGATGLASHGWTRAQADAFADECRQAGFADARVDEHRAGRRTVLSVQANAPALVVSELAAGQPIR